MAGARDVWQTATNSFKNVNLKIAALAHLAHLS
jgi:hypothetical protein